MVQLINGLRTRSVHTSSCLGNGSCARRGSRRGRTGARQPDDFRRSSAYMRADRPIEARRTGSRGLNLAASGKYSGASPFLQSARGIKGLSSNGFKTKMDAMREAERPDPRTSILEFLKRLDKDCTSEILETSVDLPSSELSGAIDELREEGFIDFAESDEGEKIIRILPAGERKLRYMKKARF
ncbi:hypothetical protein [Erythrobacter litoralis]|uniref:hypothetical protein n=1 Tax=Erythrobacter litoralis TaxID=39960 RepID=UPI0012DDAEC5|nr:hypothetical protein [Erythrobacter litoralis]